MVLTLASRDTIDPVDAADLLDLRLVRIEQVSPYRREYQLGDSSLWADATAIVGGERESWRVVDLVPRDLSLAALRLEPPHEIRPHIKHTNDGPVVTALDHCFRVPAGTLVIRTPGTSLQIQRITLTNEA